MLPTALSIIGRASLIAFFSGITPVFVVLLASLLWNEKINSAQLVGFCIIILSLIFVKYKKDIQTGQFRGWHWGAIAILCGLNQHMYYINGN